MSVKTNRLTVEMNLSSRKGICNRRGYLTKKLHVCLKSLTIKIHRPF